MGDWQEKDGALIVEIQRKWAGCAYIFISIVGFLMMAIAGLVLAGMLVDPGEDTQLTDLALPALITLFGLVLFMAGFARKKFNFYSRVRLDRDQGVLELAREKDRVEYRLPLADVERIVTHKVQKSRGGSNTGTVTTYQIFLEKRDGAHFWLDTFYNREKFTEAATMLAAYTGLALQDGTGLVADVDRQREYTDRFGDSASYTPSKYVRIGADGSGTTLTIHEHRSLFDRLMMALVFTLFLSVPVYIVATFFESNGGGSALFLVFAVPFLLLFLSVMFLVFLLTSKLYMIRYGGWELHIDLKFRFSPLNGLLGGSMTVPRDAIRAVRVNRIDEGHFWLSLVTDGSVRRPGLLFGLGAFRKPGGALPWQSGNVVSLWEVPGWAKQGPGIADLLHIETMIEKDLGVDETRE